MNAVSIELTNRMIDSVRTLVEIESPSDNPDACRHCMVAASELSQAWLGSPGDIYEYNGQPLHIWGSRTPQVLILGHLDTVWPLGTLQRIPWSCDGEVMRGPGVFDMKVGVVQAWAALHLAGLGVHDGVSILLTSDEEIGSRASQEVIREMAAGAKAVLVMEPSIDGALKTARKGTSWYDIRIRGRAAHAGLEPEKGINALLEAAALVTEFATYGNAELGTTVTPTTARAGVTSNTVPDEAVLGIDVRAWTASEQQRVDDLVRAWRPHHPEATIEIFGGGINRSAMEPSVSAMLFTLADSVSAGLGFGTLKSRAVGGASDGNITAALGVPTLDGLGAVGDGAHAEHEWASVSAMGQRAHITASLIRELLGS
jgi:glutamate carboxypeptidase